MKEKYRAISLGWGVQSFTLCAMVALGMLPKFNAVIHADTEHERQSTYEFAQRWTPWLKEHNINVVTVISQKKYKTQVVINENNTPIPALYN